MRNIQTLLSKLRTVFVLISLLAVPSIAWASPWWEATQSLANVITIAKDPGSGAIIYRQNGSYFFGYAFADQVKSQGQVVPGEILVKYKNSKSLVAAKALDSIAKTVGSIPAKTQSLNGPLGLALVKLLKNQNYFDAMKALTKNPNVAYAEPNYIAKAESVPNDPYYSQQWGPPAIHADTAWDKVTPSQRSKVTIAILDTGINASHEDLAANIVPGYNFVNNTATPTDGHGHGTHVAGIAAAIINNGRGIAGISGGSKIMPIKVLDDSGSGNYSHIIQGIQYAADHGAQVISMSLGGPGSSRSMQDAINYAINKGVTVVAAAGNEGGAVDFPGNCAGVITVGALDSNGTRASYSNFGPELDVMAPGSQIYSSYINGSSSYTYMSGTSMATPAVAGVAALVRAANPGLTPAQVSDIIDRSAADMSNPGFDNNTGYGRVDAAQAVNLALGSAPAPGPAPEPAPAPVPTPVPAPAPTPQPGVNLALYKRAVASSAESSTRTAAQAVDGNSATRWASVPGQDPQWIYVDLGKNYNVQKIVLKWEKAYARSYQVQISYDGWNWYTVYRTNSGYGGTITLSGSATARYIRVYCTRGASYGYSLQELEAYGR